MYKVIVLYGHADCGKSKETAQSEGIKDEWHQKSYEYNLYPDTLELCNKEFAQLLFCKL